MEKASSRFRIGMMFTMMGVTVIGSIVAISSGRKERAIHIDTLAKHNKEKAKNIK